MIKTINLRKLIPCLLLPIFVGLIAQLFTSNSKEVYLSLQKPPLSPPSIIFPFVWSCLYILLGIASYFIEEAGVCDKKRPRQVYLITLALNLLWPIFFFTLQWYIFSSILIIAMDIVAILNIYYYYNCDKNSAYIYLPYLIWILFATYLTIGVAALN